MKASVYCPDPHLLLRGYPEQSMDDSLDRPQERIERREMSTENARHIAACRPYQCSNGDEEKEVLKIVTYPHHEVRS